jgi:hypothetical protein
LEIDGAERLGGKSGAIKETKTYFDIEPTTTEGKLELVQSKGGLPLRPWSTTRGTLLWKKGRGQNIFYAEDCRVMLVVMVRALGLWLAGGGYG